MKSISLAFSFSLALATATSFATGPASAENDPPASFFTKYFISPDYLFREIDYRPTEDRVLNRLIAIETKNPQVQSQIGADLEGKGWPDFVNCELSPDEKWLWIDFNAGPHDFEPMLFRRVSGTTFEDITDSSGVQSELNKCYPFEESRFFGWKKDSSGVYVTLQTRGHVNGVFSYSEVLAFYNLGTQHATVLSPEFSIPTDADDAAVRAESAKETAQFRKIIGAEGAVEERSTERDLNLIYNLLKRGLNTEDQQKLVAEEKDWLTTREKKAEPEREEFTADRVDVLADRWLRLASPLSRD
ncbi:MAG: hypothetical protein JOZ21_10465 [Verrucomicrobia bacterium]|nr:hypothetical protein [Verrucomicrobiota bacterium]